jgi:hypothetical protein
MNMLFVPKETCPTVLAPWALDALVMGSRFNEPSQMQEIMALSKGFKGVYSEGGQEQSQSMQLHMVRFPPAALHCCPAAPRSAV